MPEHPIAEVARRLGVDADTLRYYERRGVVPGPRRDSRGRRVYTDDDVHLLEVLMHLRATGMPLAEIAEFTRHVADDPRGVPERLELLRAHRLRVQAQVRSWEASLVVVERKIADYERRLDGDAEPPATPLATDPA